MVSAGNDVRDKIIDGLTEYAVALNDKDAAQFGAMVYRRVARQLDPMIRPEDKCDMAFPSIIVRPDIRVACLVVIFTDRLVIAWKTPFFRKNDGPQVIPFAGITDVRRQKGTTASLRNAQLLVIDASPGATVALPTTQTDTAFSVIRAAIGSPSAG